MKKNFLFLSTLCLLMSGFTQIQAQTPHPPPPVLVIVREDIKPGKMAAHTHEARAYVEVMHKANARISNGMQDGRIAMTPIAGNQNEVMYVSAYMSFADMASKTKENEKMATGAMKADFDNLPDAELHASQRAIIASFRPEYSYNAGKPDIMQMRYMAVTTTRIKPGHGDEYWRGVREIVNTARTKAQFPGSFAVYQVRAGTTDGIYLIFRLMKSMDELDFPLTAVREAMGKEGREDMDKISDRSVMFSETSFYAINPGLSIVSPEFVAADPAFWNQKPPAPAAAARRKPAPARRNGTQ